MKFILVLILNLCLWPLQSTAGQRSTSSRPYFADSTQEKPDPKKPPGVTLTDEDLARAGKGLVPSKAVKKILPKYPKEAKKTRATGPVAVEVLVDEKGKVIKADAVSGDPVLHEAAEKAALKWRFEPTFLDGIPVKVSGQITFNFVLK